ncbi:MAG: helix-turn-helix transcriptional regulator [Armatimonadetes bacterium]|nr:helix-turn-helix transcriptional regulator [Armatimonadota bacterium]
MVIDACRERGVIGQRLSEREVEVLRELMEGKSSQEVAETLSCTPRTVGFHLANIYRKLNVSNRMQAMRRAMALGLVVW